MRSTLSHGVSSLFAGIVVSCALGEGVAVRSASRASPTIPVEVIPFPTEVGSVAVWSAITCTENGQIIVGLCRTTGTAYVVQFDDATGRFVAAVPVDSAVKDDAKWTVGHGKVHSQLYQLSDGWVYGGTHLSEDGEHQQYPGGHWFRYSPQTHELEDLGLAMPHEGLITVVADEGSRCLYALTYPGAYLLRFDLGTRKTQVLGKTSRDDRVNRAFFVLSDGCVYTNVVQTEGRQAGGIYVFDPGTEATRVVFPPVYRRNREGHFVLDDTAGNPSLYNYWLASATDATQTVAYTTGYSSGHFLALRSAGSGTLVIYDHGPTLVDCPTDEKHGPFSHAMCRGPEGRIFLTVSVPVTQADGDTRRCTHLLRYAADEDRLVDLGVLVDADGRTVASCTAMGITRSGIMYLAGSVADGATSLLRVGRLADVAKRREGRGR